MGYGSLLCDSPISHITSRAFGSLAPCRIQKRERERKSTQLWRCKQAKRGDMCGGHARPPPAVSSRPRPPPHPLVPPPHASRGHPRCHNPLNTASSHDTVGKCTPRVHSPTIVPGPCTSCVHFSHWEGGQCNSRPHHRQGPELLLRKPLC
jgi:hypothetical protein